MLTIKKIPIIWLLLCVRIAFAQSYDTISEFPPDIYNRIWYDSCGCFYNGERSFCLELANVRPDPHVGQDYNHYFTKMLAGGSLRIKGLACMVSTNWTMKCGNEQWYSTAPSSSRRVGEYLYVYELLGDTFYTELERVRWDTASPQVLKLPRTSDTANTGFDYCYLYRAYFDSAKTVTVDSLYAIGASFPQTMHEITHVVNGYPVWYVCMRYDRDNNVPRCNPFQERIIYGSNSAARLSLTDSEYDINHSDYAQRIGWGPFFPLVDNDYRMQALVHPLQAGAGSVRGSGYYIANSVHTIQAYPDISHEFDCWNDGDTSNPRTIVMTQDTVFTAYFRESESYQIAAEVYPQEGGSIMGAGIRYGGLPTLQAIPAQGYVFEHWEDGSEENPRIMLLHSDTSVAAYFRKLDTFSITVRIVPNEGGWLVTGDSVQYYSDIDTVLLFVYHNTGWHFAGWSDDTSTYYMRSLQLTSDTVIWAYFERNGTHSANSPEQEAPAMAVSPNPTSGQVTISCPSLDPARQYSFRLIDAAGRTVRHRQMQGNSLTMTVSDLPAGIYFAIIVTPLGTIWEKLVVE